MQKCSLDQNKTKSITADHLGQQYPEHCQYNYNKLFRLLEESIKVDLPAPQEYWFQWPNNCEHNFTMPQSLGPVCKNI